LGFFFVAKGRKPLNLAWRGFFGTHPGLQTAGRRTGFRLRGVSIFGSAIIALAERFTPRELPIWYVQQTYQAVSPRLLQG
jgi:hypothetical protein